MHLWRKIVAAARAEPWAERLAAAGFGPERLVVAESAASPGRTRLEIYCEDATEAECLRRDHGGRARPLRPEEWQTWRRSASDRPLVLGRRLVVTARVEELPTLRAVHPRRHVLCVPAAMAFGTGEHATTAMCLRLLDEASRPLVPGAWDLLDLGAGSGILALAGRSFGARTAWGLDHDPHAVRTARGNARLNGVRGVAFSRADLLAGGSPPAGRQWSVVMANLFSELLIRVLPTAILPALAPGGQLIASGVLNTQATEVLAALPGAGLDLVKTRARGRWRAFWCQRPVPTGPPMGKTT